ncbi:2-dehydro-3-deoxygalactonokinase [Aestuariibius insulae]|uniref:2-dehydro-3-deoxygalactonokinase n=1 Tax=Aestuariibius insulae TaxID=2058287 RepID=UPI00345ED649
MSVEPDWIAVDWGTSNLRVWAMSSADTVLAEASSDKGMGGLDKSEFEPALRELIDDWLVKSPLILCCGMVGARQGWAEAGYLSVPCEPLSGTPSKASSELDVRILPGLKQTAPPDVMRGEETQIAGFQALNPGWDGVLCLPGSHTKWVEISAGEIVSFQTFLTGELFASLSEHTVLRHTVVADGVDDEAFASAVSDAIARPERLASGLFALRAAHLLEDLSPKRARARLSGLLIGAELAAARPYWLGRAVAVIGAGGLSRLYTAALAAQGVPAIQADATRMTLAGLTKARNQLRVAS